MTARLSKPALNITHAGGQSTIQDFGRTGFRNIGVPLAGALNPVALHLANALVGNPPGQAGIEMQTMSCGIEVLADSVRFAFAGSEIAVRCRRHNGDENKLGAGSSHRLEYGDQLLPAAITDSRSAVFAFSGGFRLAPQLGSCSTDLRSGIGGYGGRALRSGDQLALNEPECALVEERCLPPISHLFERRAVRVVPGPQAHAFSRQSIDTLTEHPWEISTQSDRMGYRLLGLALERCDHREYPSSGITPGAIQVANDGQPIVLLVDAQTTGGYPRIATVISADLPLLGTMMPGESLCFEAIGVAEAEAARRALMQELDSLCERITTVTDPGKLDAQRLFDSNLISGVTTGQDPAD